MTSFLRTRKDRHPRPENKNDLPQAQVQSDHLQRNAEHDPSHLSRTVDVPHKHGDEHPYRKS